jgi:phage portal protein BeeE
MAFLDWVKNLLQPQIQQQITNLQSYRWRENPVIWWDSNNEIFWDEGFEKNGTVFSIVSKIAAKVADVPGYEYKVNNQKSLKRFKAMRSGYDIKSQVQSMRFLKSEFEPFEGSDNVTKLLKQPNEGQTFSDLIQFILINKLIFGGGPVWANPGGVDTGKTMSLYAYDPDKVQIKPSPNLVSIDQAAINFFGNIQPITPGHLYFVKYQSPRIDITGRHLFGFSPLMAGLRPLQVDNANLEAQLFIMQNKGVLGTFLPENMEALEAIQGGVDNADLLREKMGELLKYSGKDMSSQRPYINALLKYISFGMDADQMGLDASHKATKRMICQIYDYPPELLADEGTTFNNKNEAIKYLLTNTTAPHRKSIEDMVNNWLYPLNGITDRVFTLDISDMPEVQDDYAQLADKMVATQSFTRNEIREALRWDASPDMNMDKVLVSQGLIPIEDVGMDMETEI